MPSALPGDALVTWRNAVERASRKLQRREQARPRREQAELVERITKLERENERLRDDAKGKVAGKTAREKTSRPPLRRSSAASARPRRNCRRSWATNAA